MTEPGPLRAGERPKFLDALTEAIETAASEKYSLGEKLERLLGLALPQAGARRGSVMLADEKGALTLSAPAGPQGESALPEGLRRIAETFIEDGHVERRRAGGFLCIPIIVQGKAAGVLNAAGRADGDFAEEDEAVLSAFASVMSNIILADRMKKEHDMLRAAHDMLKEQGRLREDMIEMIVHDLKGPAGEIISNLDLLDESVGDGLAREALSSAESSAEDLMEMIMNILDVARLEDGKFHANPERLDVVQLARERTEKIKAMAEREGKTVSFEAAGESLFIEADRSVLSRVLWNLLSNANNHTISGDSIKVSVRREGDGAAICVSDSGPGISSGDLERIFDKFGQGGGERSRSSTGLGLTFCRMALEACGGDILVESEPGRGAAFNVRLR
ncbi:MAG: ATP-binding protein [Candidatus Nitrospinota bacterium M3_3B_026]